ncbi:MAG: penicillin-binding transpeptidase domain-containing protein [Vicinamibacterales bacterium]
MHSGTARRLVPLLSVASATLAAVSLLSAPAVDRTPAPAASAPVAPAQAPAVRRCVVIHDVAAGTTSRTGDAACATRLAPASTFKIPHALVALETGVVTAGSVERWDGTPFPGRPAWERDHTVISALRPSALWVFQRVAPRVGAARMHAWLTRFQYGNADTSGPIREYWLNGRLQISPEEQVAFLRRLYDGALPLSAGHVAAVRRGLTEAPGTVENATGLHALDVHWRDGWALEAKTGATRSADGTGISWLVGRWTIDGHPYVFAGAAWRPGEVDGLDGTRAVVDAMRARGLLR